VRPAPKPPREVVTVVHRLSGWKLLAWLATSGPPALELDELPSPTDTHTNIVAGYIYEDGRSVVTRLPQAEVELEGFPAPPAAPVLFTPNGEMRKAEPEYMLVTSDGRRVEAKFVGLDSSTGLTLLEADEPLLSGAPMGAEGDTDDPTVGQRIRLYAPTPTAAPAIVAAPAVTPGAVAQPEPGFIYMSIDEKEGLLTQVRRGASGKPFSVVASANVSLEWTGAVAANELGEVVGIVSQSSGGETQIVPLATVRSACDRVLKLRASAPQPWLGVRGDAASQAPLQTWVNFGWSPELARPHIEKRQGVFLTSVAPGTPAALAGLRPGDLIARVGPREVRSVEDLSQMLREAGVGSVIDFTVWRSLEPVPIRLPVELKGTKNPALATAEAEQRAARMSLNATQREVRDLHAALQRIKTDTNGLNDPEAAHIAARLSVAESRLTNLRAEIESAEAKANAARGAGAFAAGQQAWQLAENYPAAARLQVLGLSAIGLTPRGAASLGAQGGMLVVAVRPGTSAEASSLRAGDVIETINSVPAGRLELMRLLAVPDPTPLSLGVVREGHRLNVSFTPTAGGEQQQQH
jgi:S1-C subfamily serine protease